MLVCDLSRATEQCCASVGLFSFQCCTSLPHGTLADETVAHCLKTRALKTLLVFITTWCHTQLLSSELVPPLT